MTWLLNLSGQGPNAVLQATNKTVDAINTVVLKEFPGEELILASADSAIETDEAFTYPAEFLNSITPSGFPVHQLRLKTGCPLLLLRNINIRLGLANGTRLRLLQAGKALRCEILTGTHVGSIVLLPRVTFIPGGDPSDIPFRRRQFPVQLAFAMTINKSQGQTLRRAAIYLHDEVFVHGQLYVATSRVGDPNNIRFSLPYQRTTTTNIVYQEVL